MPDVFPKLRRGDLGEKRGDRRIKSKEAPYPQYQGHDQHRSDEFLHGRPLRWETSIYSHCTPRATSVNHFLGGMVGLSGVGVYRSYWSIREGALKNAHQEAHVLLITSRVSRPLSFGSDVFRIEEQGSHRVHRAVTICRLR